MKFRENSLRNLLPDTGIPEPLFRPIQNELRPDEYFYDEATDVSNMYKVVELNGVYHIIDKSLDDISSDTVFYPPPVTEFFNDLNSLLNTVHDGACKTVTFKRLKVLDSMFYLHQLLNGEREALEQKKVPHRDFYNVRKVDTHIHHTAIMNQKHLLRFIKHKLKHFGDELVYRTSSGEVQTLSEVFKSLNLTGYDLSIDTLDMHADTNTFHRFDRFNLKYNPIGESKLRDIFLKTSNFIGGRYLADISKEVYNDLASNKYVYIEPRISIYGRNVLEFSKLANWWFENRLDSPHVRYLIQIPRLYSVYKKDGQVTCFAEMLENIFKPLFEISLSPDSDKKLDLFLRQVVGFDCVDDESKMTKEYSGLNFVSIPPSQWNFSYDPPFSYWMYYIYANLKTLNHFRKSLNLSTFEFRPHVGEAGDMDNLASAFLLADKINHGILLRKAPTLQYLYYLCQIGVAMSPLSNNKLFLDYHSNPFPIFFARGLNVSLSTDDPLLLHITKDPLVEEYSCAAQVWKLSSADLAEIARHSVLQSGFEHPFKQHFLGSEYFSGGEVGESELFRYFDNDIKQTNLPQIRVLYRREKLKEEWEFLGLGSTLP